MKIMMYLEDVNKTGMEIIRDVEKNPYLWIVDAGIISIFFVASLLPCLL